MNMKIASFTFDDGFIKTARLVKTLAIPSTFYLVTGWLDKTVEVTDNFNKNIDHGTIQDWKEIGLDLGSHTHTHDKKINEMESITTFQKLFDISPFNLATPFGVRFKPQYFNSCKCGFQKPYNKLSRDSLKCLSSINPEFDVPNLEDVIRLCPDEHWVILTFHGIEEGWCPVSVDQLQKIYDMLIGYNFQISTISETVNEIGFSRNLL